MSECKNCRRPVEKGLLINELCENCYSDVFNKKGRKWKERFKIAGMLVVFFASIGKIWKAFGKNNQNS